MASHPVAVEVEEMSENNDTDTQSTANPVSGVFKSADYGPTRMNSMTNSAVSDVAVERSVEEPKGGRDRAADQRDVPVAVAKKSEELVEDGALEAAKAVENIHASMAKVDAAVQSIEERQAEIAESFHKAEELLAEVNRVRDALTFNDDLRKRIENTIKRTRTLRGHLNK